MASYHTTPDAERWPLVFIEMRGDGSQIELQTAFANCGNCGALIGIDQHWADAHSDWHRRNDRSASDA